jgi:hypothetical protein
MFNSKFWEGIKNNYPEGFKLFIEYLKKEYPDENEVCYCDLEKFFDDNGIIISTFFEIEKNMFHYFVYDKNKKENHSNGLFNRKSVKEYLVYKAFEIRESQLKEVK